MNKRYLSILLYVSQYAERAAHEHKQLYENENEAMGSIHT